MATAKNPGMSPAVTAMPTSTVPAIQAAATGAAQQSGPVRVTVQMNVKEKPSAQPVNIDGSEGTPKFVDTQKRTPDTPAMKRRKRGKKKTQKPRPVGPKPATTDLSSQNKEKASEAVPQKASPPSEPDGSESDPDSLDDGPIGNGPSRPSTRASAPHMAGSGQDTFEVLDRKLRGLLTATITDKAWKPDGKMKKISEVLELMNQKFLDDLCAYADEYWKLWVLMSIYERPITVFDDESIKFAIQHRVNWRLNNTVSGQTHIPARVARAISDRIVLALAVEKTPPGSMIIDVYGSTRVLDLWRAVTDKPNEKLPASIKLAWYRPLITSKDQLDYSDALKKFPSVVPSPGDTCLLLDIYEKSVLTELANWRVENVFISTQIFYKTALAGIKFGSSPYYIDKELVHQRASAFDHVWAPHPTNEFLLETASLAMPNGSFVWTTYKQISDYYIMKMRYSTLAPAIVQQVRLRDGDALIVAKTLKPQTWQHKVQGFLNKLFMCPTVFHKTLHCFQPAIDELETKMTGKTRQTYQISNIHKEVTDCLNRPEYNEFWHFMPTLYEKQRVAADTIDWLTWSTFQDDHERLKAVSNTFHLDLPFFRQLKNNFQAITPDLRSWLVIAVAGIALIKSRRLISSQVSNIASTVSTTFLSAIKDPYLIFDFAQYPRIPTLLERLKSFLNYLYDIRFQVPVVLGPVAEETLKAVHPYAPFLFGLFEAFVQLPRIKATLPPGTVMSVPLFYLVKGLLHWAVSNLPFSRTLHASANCMILGSPASYLGLSLAVFFDSGLGSPKLEQLLTAIYVGLFFAFTAPLNASSGLVQKFRRDYLHVSSHLTEYPHAFPLTLEEAVLPAVLDAPQYDDLPITRDAVLEAGTKQSVHVLLGTSSMFYRPVGPLQFWHAYQQRNLIEVPMTPVCEQLSFPPLPHQSDGWERCVMTRGNFKRLDGCPIGLRWARSVRIYRRLLRRKSTDIGYLKSLDWIHHFNGAAKKQRAADGIARRNEGTTVYKTGAFLKADEVLFGRVGLLKGRVVRTMDPTIQASLYKPVEHAMSQLKFLLNEKEPFIINGWQLTFTVGSGKLGSELDSWYAHSLEWVTMGDKRAACIFAGDDFFAMVNDRQLTYYENDFSSFDRTQGAHALEAELAILSELGMTRQQVAILWQMYQLTSKFENVRFDIKQRVPMPIQRYTGGPTTTIGNTINNQISVLYTIQTRGNMTALPEAQLELGFIAKLQIRSDNLCTFLKGWWVPTANGNQWLPLPSQVIKLGKILTDPRLIYKQLEANAAWKLAAKSMASSYGQVPFNYPIFGAFLQRYANLTDLDSTDILQYEPDRSYKVYRDLAEPVDRVAALEMIMERYDLNQEDVREMENEIHTTPFPGVMIHLGWAKLAQRDYG